MVTNGVTNLPTDGYQRLESSKAPQGANQFASALEPANAPAPQLVEKPAQDAAPSGISALYNDTPDSTQTFTQKAHQVWSFARNVVGNFGKPAGAPEALVTTPDASNEEPLTVTGSGSGGNSPQLVKGQTPLLTPDDEPDAVQSPQALRVVPAGLQNPTGESDDSDDDNNDDGSGNGANSAGIQPSLAEKYYGKNHGSTDEPDTEIEEPPVQTVQTHQEAPPPPPPSAPENINNNNNNNNNGNNGNNGNGMFALNSDPPVLQYAPVEFVPPSPQPQQYDPNTGLPLNLQAQQYDPITGLPVTPQLQQYDPTTGLPLTMQPNQLQTLFSQVGQVASLPPVFGLTNDPNNSFANFQLPTFGMPNPQSMFNLPLLPTGGGTGQTWSQGLYGDILGSYFGGMIPPGGASSTAGLQFTPGF